MYDFGVFPDPRPEELPPWLARFEDRRVKQTLREFGLLGHLVELLNDTEEDGGQRRLTFTSLHRLWPNFPVLLAARGRTRVAERCRPGDLFRAFADVFFFPDYLGVFSSRRDEARGRPIGMVLPFDGLRGGLVVHNAAWDTRGTQLLCPVPDDRPPHRVRVEAFSGFLRYLARSGWTPETPLPDAPQAATAQVAHVLPVTPALVARLGPGPALLVLVWLRGVLQSASGYDRLFVRRRSARERCVAGLHEQVAAQTGLSPRQVKRGLASLRREGLIRTWRHQGRTHICLESGAVGQDEADG
jgi:hypothetical protein